MRSNGKRTIFYTGTFLDKFLSACREKVLSRNAMVRSADHFSSLDQTYLIHYKKLSSLYSVPSTLRSAFSHIIVMTRIPCLLKLLTYQIVILSFFLPHTTTNLHTVPIPTFTAQYLYQPLLHSTYTNLYCTVPIPTFTAQSLSKKGAVSRNGAFCGQFLDRVELSQNGLSVIR